MRYRVAKMQKDSINYRSFPANLPLLRLIIGEGGLIHTLLFATLQAVLVILSHVSVRRDLSAFKMLLSFCSHDTPAGIQGGDETKNDKNYMSSSPPYRQYSNA